MTQPALRNEMRTVPESARAGESAPARMTASATVMVRRMDILVSCHRRACPGDPDWLARCPPKRGARVILHEDGASRLLPGHDEGENFTNTPWCPRMYH